MMTSSEKNVKLKNYFERRFGGESARANGTILGYATGYYVVSAILRYWEFHPGKEKQPIKFTKLAKYATPRPFHVMESDGLRFYRLLQYAENSGILSIKSRRQFLNGSLGVVVELNPNARLSDYEVEWPSVPEISTGVATKVKGDGFFIVDENNMFGIGGEYFWNDGWTEYDAKFIYKGIYKMLLRAAMDRGDRRAVKEVEANYNKLYPMLNMVMQECEILLQTIKRMDKN